MATRQSTRIATAGTQPKALRAGLVAVTGTYSVAAATSLSAGDVIQMVKVPANATLVYMALVGGSGDALVTVGDTVSTARYLSSVTMGSNSAVIRTINTLSAPYTYSVESTVDITVGTVSVGTITGGFHMTCIFSMDV
jgi:hypothetical protein